MSSVEDFLAELAQLDVKIWAEEGKLRINAPDQVLTEALQAQLRMRKPELIAFLSKTESTPESVHKIKPFPRENTIPLTYGQERIWSLARMEPDSSLYNVPTVFLLNGPLNIKALERSLVEIQRRHEILRTIFPGEDLASARQVILPDAKLILPVTEIGRDLAKLSKQSAGREVMRILQAEARQPFDILKGPLWRARLFRLGARRHVLSLIMHHIIFDGLSKVVFLAELANGYQAYAANNDEAAFVAPLSIQFADFAAWQRQFLDERNLQRQLAYWSKRLEGDVPALAVPNDRARVSEKGRAGVVQFEIPAKLSKELEEFSRKEHAGLYVTLLAAFQVLLRCFSGQEDLLVCSPTASRDNADLEKMIGYFNNVVVIRGDLSANLTFRALVGQLRRLTVEAYDNQNLPLQHLAQQPNLIRTPLTRAMFSYQDTTSRRLDLPEIKAEPINIRKEGSDFELAMYIENDAGVLYGVLEFNAGIFGHKTIDRFLKGFGRVLNLIAANPDRLLSDFPRFGGAEQRIEETLAAHSQIDRAAAVINSASGRPVVYLVLNEHDVPDLEAIRAHAKASLPDYLVPISFITIDEMPLLPDGSVDKAALPVPLIDRHQLASAYVAPRNALEEKLAAVWKKVLWLNYDVGIHDRFRDLGGHSLLSVQLIVEVEKALQHSIPPQAINANTVAEMAEAIDNADRNVQQDVIKGDARSVLPPDIYRGLRTYTASWEGVRTTPESIMVGLNVTGKKQALFWCLQRYQELTQFAKYLGPDQPVYGMRSGNYVMVKTQDNINLLAKHYVSEILQTQPTGPYMIGGNCQAAKIAFQIATQLKALGHEITLLIVMEKFIPMRYDGPVAMLWGEFTLQRLNKYFHQPSIGWRKYYTGPFSMSVVPGEHAQYFREPNVQVLMDTVRDRMQQAQQRNFSAWMTDKAEPNYQYLPEEAYRAKLIGPSELHMVRGANVLIPITVKNSSACYWQASEESGIFLVNRWLDSDGKAVGVLDGRSDLPGSVAPAAETKLEISVKAPTAAGLWTLELDLVEEGVTWFQDQGSTPLQIKCVVKDS